MTFGKQEILEELEKLRQLADFGENFLDALDEFTFNALSLDFLGYYPVLPATQIGDSFLWQF